jgi:hypothetical protein
MRMTQEEVIEMARQADVWVAGQEPYQSQLEAFAKLVAEKEREECAMLCLWHNNTMSQTPTLFHMAELIRARGQA